MYWSIALTDTFSFHRGTKVLKTVYYQKTYLATAIVSSKKSKEFVMKKVLYALAIIVIGVFVFYDDIFPQPFSEEEYYEPKNEREHELYSYAYTEGQEDALLEIEDVADPWVYYINPEDAYDMIYQCYDSDTAAEICDILADCDSYSEEDIVRDVAKEVNTDM